MVPFSTISYLSLETEYNYWQITFKSKILDQRGDMNFEKNWVFTMKDFSIPFGELSSM